MNNLSLRGTELNAVDFAFALRGEDFESVIVGPCDTIPRSGATLIDVARERGVEVIPFDRPPTLAAWTRQLDRLAAEIKPDLVHVYGPHIARAAYLGPCKFGRIPLVLTDYEMKLADDTLDGPLLIVGTKYLLDTAVRPGTTVLISPPVDLNRDRLGAVDMTDFRSQFDLVDEYDLVVLVSRLDSAMKADGIRNAVLAMAMIDSRDVALVIVGTGNIEHDLRALAADIESRTPRRRIVFTGSLGDPRPAYAAGTISLGMGGSAARALGFGKPLIVLGEAGWSSIFTPTAAQVLYANSFWSQDTLDNPVAVLAGQIDRLLHDTDERDALGAFGRAFATENFGLTAMTDLLASCYRRAEVEYGFRAWLIDLPNELRAGAERLIRSGPSYFFPQLRRTQVRREQIGRN